jgi:streptogramin lyase
MADPNPTSTEARMSITGTVTTFNDPTTSDGPFEIVAGPDGNLWYTAGGSGAIGMVKMSLT